MPELSALRSAAHPDLPDCVVLANLIVVEHRDHSLYFLEKKTKNRYCAQSSKEHENVKYKKEPCKAYLHLVLWDLKAEGLVVVRVQCVLLHSRLLLLQPLAVLHKMNLHVGICRGLPVQEVMHLHTVDVSACVLCILIVFWEHLICD